MSGQSNGRVVANPWQALRAHTPARIALGRAGGSLPTSPQLAFQLAHAQARDAVHRPLDVEALLADLAPLGLPTLALHSAATDRPTYLQRPDLGRCLDEASRARLLVAGERPTQRAVQAPDASPAARAAETPDLVFVVADGLSALAVQRHAAPLIAAVLPRLQALGEDGSPPWRIAPVVVVVQGRVAVGDDVGGALGARCAVVLIGERPGLSSPDSLGLYLTWSPCPGRTDAQRNCISNVRPEGLPIDEAADQLVRLLTLARARGLTGVALKDDREAAPVIAGPGPRPAFLLGD